MTESRRHFPSLGETLQCRKSSKKLTEKSPSEKENNKLSEFKVLRQHWRQARFSKPAKTVTPAFSFDCTQCGQVWTSNEVYLRAVKVSLTKGKIHTLLLGCHIWQSSLKMLWISPVFFFIPVSENGKVAQ